MLRSVRGRLGSSKPKQLFFLEWFMATILGWNIAVLVTQSIVIREMQYVATLTTHSPKVLGPLSMGIVLLYLAVLPSLAGLLSSCLQVVVLCVYLRQFIGRLAACVIAWTLPYVILLPVVLVGSEQADSPVTVGAILIFLFLLVTDGLLHGALQWIVLRRRGFASGSWIVGTGAGWLLARLLLLPPGIGSERFFIAGRGPTVLLWIYLSLTSLVPATITALVAASVVSRAKRSGNVHCPA